MISVLVVDDSAVIRRLITSALADDPEIRIIGTASNGQLALSRIDQLKPDIVTLDVEMPVMNGLETLRVLRPRYPRLPVIMFSTLTAAGATLTLDALAAGATDYITKPTKMRSLAESIRSVREQLIPRIHALCAPKGGSGPNGRPAAPPPGGPGRGAPSRAGSTTRRQPGASTGTDTPPRSTAPSRSTTAGRPATPSRSTPGRPATPSRSTPGRPATPSRSGTPPRTGTPPRPAVPPRTAATTQPEPERQRETGHSTAPPRGRIRTGRAEVVAVGCSTGGPDALSKVLQALPGSFPAPLLVVQHMPPVFTKMFAERLDRLCALNVVEAVGDVAVKPGTVYIAPGDFHLEVVRRGQEVRTRLQSGALENFCRPAVDVLFRSVARTYAGAILAVVLTGMGQDGKRGCEELHAAGAEIVAQDEATSVVWGMPGAVVTADLADTVLPLDGVANHLITRITGGRPTPAMEVTR